MKKIVLFSLIAMLGGCALLPTKPNVVGVYKGTLTCADCEKIEAELTLNADNSYQYHTAYYFKDKPTQQFNENGQFAWSENKSNSIVLTHSVNLPLRVNGDSLEFCNKNGEPVQGNVNYKLFKVK